MIYQKLLTFIQQFLFPSSKYVRKLYKQEEKIYNDGERLIPDVTHDEKEKIRHFSSYIFFRATISHDIKKYRNVASRQLKIIDLGCGVGYGCSILADFPNVKIIGVDSSSESILYAKRHYNKKNIIYKITDLKTYIPTMPFFDYSVSRGVFEHIKNGLELAKKTKFRYRLFFDVPYNEEEGNIHHRLLHITEKDFAIFKDAELFYQDLDGVIYDKIQNPQKPNMIICVWSNPQLAKVKYLNIVFPLPAWNKTGI